MNNHDNELGCSIHFHNFTKLTYLLNPFEAHCYQPHYNTDSARLSVYKQ